MLIFVLYDEYRTHINGDTDPNASDRNNQYGGNGQGYFHGYSMSKNSLHEIFINGLYFHRYTLNFSVSEFKDSPNIKRNYITHFHAI